MELIYNNFDALDISFQGAMPEAILEQLSKVREQAQNEKRDVLTYLGKNKLPVMVAETGARGGYRYRFDTGPDGEIWFIMHSTNSKNWNIRVSVKSLKLALSGYEAVKRDIMKRLIDFEAIGASAYSGDLSASSKRLFLPLERISRFDYCFDFVMPSAFEPLPKRFVAHHRAKKHVYSIYTALNGEKINTIRVGEMPGRQAVIYNKTEEIKSSSKKYWWDIWGIDPKSFQECNQQIWRIEVRAGKGELDKWGLKRFEDFDDKAGDVIASILKAIRYTEPSDDTNRSRWPMHPIWESAISTSCKALAPYSTNAIRENIIRDHRKNVINGYDDRLIGNLIGRIAAQGRDISELPVALEEIETLIEKSLIEDKALIAKKYEKAEERFRFLI